MELVEYLVFILINIVFVFLVLYKRIGLLSVFGMLFNLFLLPFTIHGLVIGRYVVADSTGQTHQVLVYADPTLMVIISIMLIVMHGIALLKVYSGAKESV